MTLEAVHTDDLAGTGGNNTEGEVVASDKLEFDSADGNLAVGYEVNDLLTFERDNQKLTVQKHRKNTNNK